MTLNIKNLIILLVVVLLVLLVIWILLESANIGISSKKEFSHTANYRKTTFNDHAMKTENIVDEENLSIKTGELILPTDKNQSFSLRGEDIFVIEGEKSTLKCDIPAQTTGKLPVEGFRYYIITNHSYGQWDLNSSVDSQSDTFRIVIRRLDDDDGWKNRIYAKIKFNIVNTVTNISRDVEYDIAIEPCNFNVAAFDIQLKSNVWKIRPIDVEKCYKETSIPKIVIQTSLTRSLTRSLRNALLSILDKNPEYEHKFYDNTESRKFIIEHFSDNTIADWCSSNKIGPLISYDTIIPGAFKADIFRLCALYINGGVYIDHKVVCMRPFREYIEDEDSKNKLLFAADIKAGCLLNAIMFSNRLNPHVLEYLYSCCYNIGHRLRGSNAFDITGPKTFGRYVNRAISRLENSSFQDGIKYETLKSPKGLFSTVISWNRPSEKAGTAYLEISKEKIDIPSLWPAFLYRPNNYYSKNYNDSKHYSKMWWTNKLWNNSVALATV